MEKRQIKKVLSIDLDYLVGNALQLYNDLCGNYAQNGNPESELYWKHLDDERYINKFLDIDKNNEKFLDQLIEKTMKKLPKENIFFSIEHDGFLEFLCGDAAKYPEEFDLWNIDHHTDIFYGADQRERAELYQVATIGSWVHYLGVNNKVYKYHFVGNERSVRNSEQDRASLTYPVDLFATQEDIKDVDFDYLLICKSPGFLPYKMQYKFDEYLHKAEELKKASFTVEVNPYNFNGRSRGIAREGYDGKQI